MGLNATARRRWFGALMLLAALAMLIAGLTFLEGRLRDIGYLIYWLVCFGFTGMAILVAYLDARELRRRTRREARELIESTVRKIEKDAQH
jgi:hypothetical protein